LTSTSCLPNVYPFSVCLWSIPDLPSLSVFPVQSMPRISSHVHTISSPHLTVLESSAPAYPFPSLPTTVDPPPSSYCCSPAPLLSPLYLNLVFPFLCPLIEELVMRSVDSFCRVKLSLDVMLIISCLLFVERSGWSSASTRQIGRNSSRSLLLFCAWRTRFAHSLQKLQSRWLITLRLDRDRSRDAFWSFWCSGGQGLNLWLSGC